MEPPLVSPTGICQASTPEGCQVGPDRAHGQVTRDRKLARKIEHDTFKDGGVAEEAKWEKTYVYSANEGRCGQWR